MSINVKVIDDVGYRLTHDSHMIFITFNQIRELYDKIDSYESTYEDNEEQTKGS